MQWTDTPVTGSSLLLETFHSMLEEYDKVFLHKSGSVPNISVGTAGLTPTKTKRS